MIIQTHSTQNINLRRHLILVIMLGLALIQSCSEKDSTFDATGVFETDEVIISAEAVGILDSIQISEGQSLTKNQTIGKIDCKNLELQKQQIEATIEALGQKQNQAAPQNQIFREQIKSQQAQLDVLLTQKQVLETEVRRVKNLVDSQALPQKSIDDLEGQMQILDKQIEATRSSINITDQQIKSNSAQISIQNKGLLSESGPLQKNVEMLEEQLGKCAIINPIEGIVLEKYIEEKEMVTVGKPLYKIANLSVVYLRAYITGDQFAGIKLNQVCQIKIDDGEGKAREYEGRISWISSKAEFTPKTIQTKDERASLVYPIKVEVQNDGFIKIGMYGELIF